MAVKYPDILESNNPQEYGIVPAKQVAGHKTVNTLNDLYSIADAILSLSKINTGNDAIGQLWYVISEGKYYQLIDWNNRKNSSGWEENTLSNLQKITYSELVSLVDNNKLIPGLNYRIIDYQCTTTQEETKSAGHVFDIIVQALSEDTLSEEARAILHEGDTYFVNCDLSAWKLWYSLDNNKERFVWADETNGKGVIYRMIDEKNNDCPYDFKNILFYTNVYTSYTTADKYYYTFSYVVNGVLYDGTVEKQVKDCHNNRTGVYIANGKSRLNANIFRNTVLIGYCHSNTFGNNCYNSTFGNNCHSNTFENSCHSNTFGNFCYSNTFGDSCCYNTFENSCRYNTFVDNCSSNTFGDNCYSNTFGANCSSNTFENTCYYNTFGNYCSLKLQSGTTLANCVVLNNVRGTISAQGMIGNKHIAHVSNGGIKIFSLIEQIEHIEELNNTITQQNTVISDLIKRIEKLEQGGGGSSADVEDSILYATASVVDGVMNVQGSVIDGILNLGGVMDFPLDFNKDFNNDFTVKFYD